MCVHSRGQQQTGQGSKPDNNKIIAKSPPQHGPAVIMLFIVVF